MSLTSTKVGDSTIKYLSDRIEIKTGSESNQIRTVCSRDVDSAVKQIALVQSMAVESRAEIERLEAIVSKLPTDGDGMPIVPGMDIVWYPGGHYDNIKIPLRINSSGQAIVEGGGLFTARVGGGYVFASQCYYMQDRAKEVRAQSAVASKGGRNE